MVNAYNGTSDSVEKLTYIDQKGHRKKISKMLRNIPGAIEAVVISSKDGLLVGGVGENIDLDQTAAISASVLSLADAISSRSSEEGCQKVLSKSGDSDFLILHTKKFIITIIGGPEANMGLLLTAGKALAANIMMITHEKEE